MEQFGFSICMDSLGQILAFGLLGFTAVGIGLEGLLQKLKASKGVRSVVMTVVLSGVTLPVLAWLFYTPFSGVSVGQDHIEVQYWFPRPSERISFNDLRAVNAESTLHAVKQSRYSTACLELVTKDGDHLRSFDTRPGNGESSVERAELAINKAREKANPTEAQRTDTREY